MEAHQTVRARVIVAGFVQGVGFRAFTRNQAQRMNLTGWVRNAEDGRVQIEVEGEKQTIESLVEALKKGPSLSRVDAIDVEWGKASGQNSDFRIC